MGPDNPAQLQQAICNFAYAFVVFPRIRSPQNTGSR